MDLKFYLNKFAKVDNIENYTLKALKALQKVYTDYLEKTDGTDPDFPMMTLGGNKGKKVKGKNASADSDNIAEGDNSNNHEEI